MVELSASEQNSLFKRKSTFYKMLMSYMVVFSHARNCEIYRIAEMSGFLPKLMLFIDKNWYILTFLIIPSFMFLSGFSFFSNYSPKKTLDKFRNRFFTLFIPWICWNTIMWLLFLLIKKIPALASHMNTLPDYQFTFRSWLVDGLYLSADGPMWFILNLMAAVLLSPLVYQLIRNKYVGIAAFVLWFAAVSHWHLYHYSIVMTTLFFAEAGYYSIHLRPLFLRHYKTGVRLAALALLLLYFLFFRTEDLIYGGFSYALTASVMVPALWVLLGDVELKGFWKKMDAYRFWIYASHYFPLECVEKLWLIVGGISAAAAVADFILAPIITMALLVAVSVPLRKFCPTLWKVLNGAFFPKGMKKQTAR